LVDGFIGLFGDLVIRLFDKASPLPLSKGEGSETCRQDVIIALKPKIDAFHPNDQINPSTHNTEQITVSPNKLITESTFR